MRLLLVAFCSSLGYGYLSLYRTPSNQRLNVILNPAEFSTTSSSLAEDIQNIAVVVGGVAFLLWEKRPKGSARIDLVDVQKSLVPGAGLGAFAVKTIPKGTVVGEYPGKLISAEDAISSKKDEKAKERSKRYMWGISDTLVLDPTNDEGTLDLEISYLGGLVKISTTMARINEPPVGKDCNVYPKVRNEKVEIVTERDIFVNEELYIDYGSNFYRNDYFIENSALDPKKARELQDEYEKLLTIQPINLDSTDNKLNLFGQDTTLPGKGFISKLREQDNDLFKKNGILSPEDGLGLFRV